MNPFRLKNYKMHLIRLRIPLQGRMICIIKSSSTYHIQLLKFYLNYLTKRGIMATFLRSGKKQPLFQYLNQAKTMKILKTIALLRLLVAYVKHSNG